MLFTLLNHLVSFVLQEPLMTPTTKMLYWSAVGDVCIVMLTLRIVIAALVNRFTKESKDLEETFENPYDTTL